MSSCKLVIKDEVNVKFENLSLEWRKRLSNKFKYEIPERYWKIFFDGKVVFYKALQKKYTLQVSF